jgi:hypothetical protein
LISDFLSLIDLPENQFGISTTKLFFGGKPLKLDKSKIGIKIYNSKFVFFGILPYFNIE